jgi:serine/threonine protein phosphatase PrpC
MESINIFSFNQSSTAEQNTQNRPAINASGSTDIGGGSDNQDQYSILYFEFNGHSIRILIILDGHGGKNGRFVAEIAKTFLEKYFSENLLLLLENTPECLNIVYTLINEEIRKSLKEKTLKENRIVEEVDGYLTSGYNSYSHSLISGGTTCTIAVIIDNIHMYVSNVGDSDAILFTTSNISSKVITDVKDDAINFQIVQNENISNVHVCTGNHSAENIHEFDRVRKNFTPYLIFEYDKYYPKGYFDIYEKNVDDDNYHITGKGNYVKNTRNEYGSIVSAPKSAPFDSSLSMTRSLGDFYLQKYGVTFIPSIKYINLNEIFEELPIISLLIASDGVWDNWTYEDISKFILNEDYLNRINNNEDISQEVCNSLIAKNDELGRKHFGTSRDNATAILAYFKKN